MQVCKNTFLACLLGSQYLSEILEIVTNSENAIKSGRFEKRFRWRAPMFFFQMRERYNVSCIKILIFC